LDRCTHFYPPDRQYPGNGWLRSARSSEKTLYL